MNIKIVVIIVSIFSFQCVLAGNGKDKPPSKLELRLQALENRVFELESFHLPTFIFTDTYTGGVVDTQTGHVKALREFLASHLNDTDQYLYVKYETKDISLITEQCFPVEHNSLAPIANLNDYPGTTLTIYPQVDNAYYQHNNAGWVSENMFIIIAGNYEGANNVRFEYIALRFYDASAPYESILYDIDNLPYDTQHQGGAQTFTNDIGVVTPDTVVTYTIGTNRIQTCGF